MVNAIELSQAQDVDTGAIERADLAESTKYKYRREVEAMSKAGVTPLDHQALTAYAAGLKSSRRAFLKSALRLMTADLEQTIKASSDGSNRVTAALHRLEAMRGAINVKAHKGQKAHTWLSPAQVKQITALCADDLEGRRDWIILGLLLGAGLRRDELAGLTFEALKQQPAKNGKIRDVLQVTGKGAKDRVIPIKPLLAERLRSWQAETGGGKVARSLGRSKKLGASLSAVGIFQLVRRYGAMIGLPELDPHDLRRSYAQIGYESGVPITQISKLLGHASVSTTQRYLNLDLDLETTASDFIPLAGD